MVECKKCGIAFEPQKGLISYCSLSCRNSRERSEEIKEKIRKGSIINRKNNPRKGNGCKSQVVHYNTCKICEKVFVVKTSNIYKKTCSKECATVASTKLRKYQNGSRKPEWYFNKWEKKEVLLESSWEVEIAKLLDSLEVKWIRPKFLRWVDENQKNRIYYPDFYLNDLNLYLDPKNPYCMGIDKFKMTQISKQVNIWYGDLEELKIKIRNVA